MKSLFAQVGPIQKVLLVGILIALSTSYVHARSYSKCYSGVYRHHGGHHHRGYHRGHHYRGHHGFHFRRYKGRRHRSHHRRHRHSSFRYYYPRTYYYSSNYCRRPYADRRSYREKNHYDNGNDEYSAQYKYDTSREQPISYKKRTNSSPWANLANNKPRTALRTFGRLASQDPDNGMHKVGYAIAAGLQGDYKRAEWAMRRAFRIDPNGIKFITKNKDLNYKVMELSGTYSRLVKNSINNANASFMHATVSYLQKDFDTAKSAITKAIKNGDADESTQNLLSLIQAKTEQYN